MCKAVIESGLGIHMLQELNNAGLCNLAWEFLKKKKHWSVFLHARFFNGGVPLNYYKNPSVWHGIKEILLQLKPDVAWSIDCNSVCNLWVDNWFYIGPMIERAPSPYQLLHTRNNIVGQFVQDGSFVFSGPLRSHVESLGIHVEDIVIPMQQLEDELLLTKNMTGKLTVKEAYNE